MTVFGTALGRPRPPVRRDQRTRPRGGEYPPGRRCNCCRWALCARYMRPPAPGVSILYQSLSEGIFPLFGVFLYITGQFWKAFSLLDRSTVEYLEIQVYKRQSSFFDGQCANERKNGSKSNIFLSPTETADRVHLSMKNKAFSPDEDARGFNQESRQWLNARVQNQRRPPNQSLDRQRKWFLPFRQGGWW